MPWPIMPMPMKPIRGSALMRCPSLREEVEAAASPAPPRRLAPERRQPGVARGDVGDDRVVAHRPANQAAAASPKIERPTAKPLQTGVRRGGGEARRQRRLARLEAEQQDAAAMRIVALRSRRRSAPTRARSRAAAASTSRAGRRRRRSARARGRGCRAPARHSRGGITSTSSSRSVPMQARCSACSRSSCAARSVGRIVRVVADQALGDVLGRPGAQRQRQVGADLEGQRPRARAARPAGRSSRRCR